MMDNAPVIKRRINQGLLAQDGNYAEMWALQQQAKAEIAEEIDR